MAAIILPTRISATGLALVLFAISFLLSVVGVIALPLTKSWRKGMSDPGRRPRPSGEGRNRSAAATDVTGTAGQRSDLARCGARYPTAAAERG